MKGATRVARQHKIHKSSSSEAGPSTSRPAKTSHRRTETAELAPREDGGSADSDRVYDALMSLGAPKISREDFEGLYKGSVAEVLSLVAEHMKGRRGVADARASIQAMLQSGTPLPTASDGSTNPWTRAKYANALSVGTKHEHEDARANYAERAKSVKEVEDQVRRLEDELERKRLVRLLLGTLKGKLETRRARLEELARLLEELSKDAPHLVHGSLGDDPQEGPSVSTSIQAHLPSMDHTQDVLASLHEYHIRLHRLQELSSKTTPEREEQRLRRLIAQKLNLPENHQRVEQAFEGCTRIAKQRASASLRYTSPLSDEDDPPSTRGMEELRKRVIAKEEALQQLSDQSLELGLSSAKALQTILTFTEVTAPELRESLDEQVSASQGYVDTLHSSIVDKMQSGEGEHRLHDYGGKSWRETLDSTRDKLEQIHDLEEFMQRTQLSPPSDANKYDRLLKTYRQEQSATDDRIAKLLTRKYEKARAGDVLIREVEGLVKEVEAVVELAGSGEKYRVRS